MVGAVNRSSTAAENAGLVCEHSKLKVFWQFDQVFQLVNYLLQEESSQSFVSSIDKAPIYRAIDLTHIGLVAVNLSGQVEYFNPAIATLWQIPYSVLFTREHRDYLSYFQTQVQSPRDFGNDMKQLASQPLAAGVTTIELADSRVLEQSFRPRYADGKVVGRLWAYAESQPHVEASPITVMLKADIKTVQQERDYLYRQMAADQAIAQQKRQLTAQIIHRALTSLNVATMTADLIEKYYSQWSDVRKQKYIGQAKAAFNQINNFVNRIEQISSIGVTDQAAALLDIALPSTAISNNARPNVTLSNADLSRINLSRVALLAGKSTPTDPYKICCDLVEDFKVVYKQHAFVSLNATSPVKTHSHITYLYESLLKAILMQLLENASQYSSSSLVKVILTEAEDSLTLQVHDMGIGILPAEREQVFEPFYRGSNVGETEGVGIGLTVVKALSEALYGEVQLSSRPGAGTRVKVILPVARCP